MKQSLFIIGIFVLLCNYSIAQKIYTTLEAKDHIGDSIYVKGVVSEIYTSEKGNITVVFDKGYPEETFSFIVFKKYNIDAHLIKIGSVVTVYGWIISGNDKPQMWLQKQSQIVKVE